jgi:hypothetical protein
MATKQEINKAKLGEMTKRVDELCKDTTFTDGAGGDKVEQFHASPGSGKTATPEKGKMDDGATGEKPEKGLNSKGGSGASANDQFTGMNQTGATFKDGSKDTEITKGKAKGKAIPKKGKGNIKGEKGGIATPASAKVPAPKKSKK